MTDINSEDSKGTELLKTLQIGTHNSIGSLLTKQNQN